MCKARLVLINLQLESGAVPAFLLFKIFLKIDATLHRFKRYIDSEKTFNYVRGVY